MILWCIGGDDAAEEAQDYSVSIAGGFAASQLTSNYLVADGIRLPTRRRAYTRGPDRKPILEMLMVSIDIADVKFTSNHVNDLGSITIRTGDRPQNHAKSQ
jgi:hypothetical protein